MATEADSGRGRRTPRFRTAGLGVWLGAGSVAIVLLAVVFVAITSIGLLGKLAERQAITRVQLAGASATEYLRRTGEDVLSGTRVLAERPTLRRLLTQGFVRGVAPTLQRSCQTGGFYACAVFQGDNLAVAVAAQVPWADAAAAQSEQGERFLVASRDSGTVLIGAAAAVPQLEGFKVLAVKQVDEKLLAEIKERAGAAVAITNYATYVAPPEDPFTELHTEALSNGRVAVRRLKSPNVYAATLPWSAVTGEMIGLIDVQVDAAQFDSSVWTLAWRLAAIALLVITIAALGGVIYGQWLVRPLKALRAAADRIGRGDFSVAVPSSRINEIEALAQTMDEMRSNLVDLTAVLRRREAEARAVLSGVVEGVYAVDSGRVIRYANSQVARMLGRPPEEIVGRFCGDVLNPERKDGVRPCDFDCPILAARLAPEARAAERLMLPDGSVRSTVIVSAAPIEGQQVQVLRDETELESVRRARDGVLANISHEFRTPLAAQLASIELLKDGLENMQPTEQRELFQHLERGVLRLMRLIDNLLESVRIEAGQLNIRRQNLAITDVTEEAAALVQPLLAQRRQSLVAEWPEGIPPITGDGQRLAQVFVNLLANASKYAPEGTAIHLGGEMRGERLVAWVEDEGPGLSDSDADTVFQRFRRSGDVEPEAPGLGLGLWIVRSIIERHGGEVGMERTPAGRTRFFVALPVGDNA